MNKKKGLGGRGDGRCGWYKLDEHGGWEDCNVMWKQNGKWKWRRKKILAVQIVTFY